MKRTGWAGVAVFAALLLTPANLFGVWDVTGTLKKDGTTLSDCATIKALSNNDCTGSTATGTCDGSGNYEICDISFQPGSIYVVIDDCYTTCVTTGPFWGSNDSCGDNTPPQSSQVRNIDVYNTCD